MSEPETAPRVVPLTVALIVLLWLFVTTGGRQIFVKEVLGAAYDSQAEHFLRGDPGVDVDDIRHEAMIVDGKVRMYFGPFPALLRIPLNCVYPNGRGTWSRFSGFCAGVISLVAFAGLLRDSLRKSSLSRWARDLVANSCLLGLALASPLLLLLGNLSIYNEAVIWGFAWSISALFFAYRCRDAGDSASPWALLGFSFSAAAALLSRVTFGLPLLVVALLIVPKLGRQNRLLRLAALCVPLGLGIGFYLLLSYARFGTLTGVGFDAYINPVHREFVHQRHMFDLRRLPTSVADYFGFRFPHIENHAPFLRGERFYHRYGPLYSLDFSETYLSILWASTWLVFGAVVGFFLLLKKRGGWFDWVVAAACAIESLLVLSYFTLAQRYAADLYPLLIVCLLVFLRANGEILRHTRYVLLGLVIFSAVVNSLTTLSWLINADQNVPPETRAAWHALLGQKQ